MDIDYPPTIPSATWIGDLRELLDDSGPNKHDQAIVIITACLAERVNTSRAIFAVTTELGFNQRHVSIVLHGHLGTDPRRHRWSKGDDGRYHLLD